MRSMSTDETTLRGHLPLPKGFLRLLHTAQLSLESMCPQDLVVEAEKLQYRQYSRQKGDVLSQGAGYSEQDEDGERLGKRNSRIVAANLSTAAARTMLLSLAQEHRREANPQAQP